MTTPKATPRLTGMTVQQVIAALSKMPDKSIKVLIDCPYCGKGNQLSKVDEFVVLASEVQQ
jgi:hypothetical protein